MQQFSFFVINPINLSSQSHKWNSERAWCITVKQNVRISKGKYSSIDQYHVHVKKKKKSLNHKNKINKFYQVVIILSRRITCNSIGTVITIIC